MLGHLCCHGYKNVFMVGMVIDKCTMLTIGLEVKANCGLLYIILYTVRHQTSSFAPVIITTAARGLSTGHNKLMHR